MATPIDTSRLPTRTFAGSVMAALADLARWPSRGLRLGLALGVATLLTACASPLTTQVTSFNRWPADAAGSTFGFLTPPQAASELEQATYQGYVQTALEQQGLRRAAAGQPARLQVEVTATLTSQTRTDLVPVYQDRYVYLPPYRDPWGRLYGGGWAPSVFGPQYVGDQAVLRHVNLASLRLRILDTRQTDGASGQTPAVFEATSLHQSNAGDLPTVMPYLVRSVFDGFPGQSGTVRTVNFDRETGAVIDKR